MAEDTFPIKESLHNPQFKSETQLIKELYQERLKNLMGEGVKIKMFSTKSEFGEQRGIMVVKENVKENPGIKYIIFADHDDTFEAYTKRKELYSKNLYESLAGKIDGVSYEDFSKFLKISNELCRVLPFTGTHPKRYSPLLEMAMESMAVNEFLNGNHQIFQNPNQDSLKKFMEEKVLRMFPDQVESVIPPDRDKKYLRESKHQALAVDWEKRPDIVSEEVWESYKNLMVKKVMLEESETKNFNFSPEVFLIPTTFGQIDFQPEKVISFWEMVKERTGRTPDAIIFFTRGRKEGYLEGFDEYIRNLIKADETTVSVALDDSLRQLEAYSKLKQFTLIRAMRADSKRSSEPTPGYIPELSMDGDYEASLEDRIRQIVQSSPRN